MPQHVFTVCFRMVTNQTDSCVRFKIEQVLEQVGVGEDLTCN